MATLEELLDIEGVVAAGEFGRDGSLVNYEAKTDMSQEMAQMTAQFCATVTMMFDTLAFSFTRLSGMDWVPQQGWAYSGGIGRCASAATGGYSWRRPRPTSTSCSRPWAEPGSEESRGPCEEAPSALWRSEPP